MPADPRTWVWDCRGLTPAQRLTLFALSDQADADQGTCRVSLSELAEQTELSRRGVIKALGELDGRFIDRERGGPGRRTRYRLRWDDAVALLPEQSINAAAHEVLDLTLPSTAALSLGDLPVQTLIGNAMPDQPEPARPVSITPSTTARAFSAPASEPPAPVRHEAPMALGNPVLDSGALNAPSAPEVPRAPVHSVPPSDEPYAPTEALSTPALVHSVPPNTSNNQSIQDKDASLLLEQTPRARTSQRAQPIPEDWMPAARVYVWAEKQGLTKEWVDAQIDEFVIYWSDAGERRKELGCHLHQPPDLAQPQPASNHPQQESHR
ncbi:MAG: DnaT-like ssDNA-binding domain-containing protein [Lamprobacter sp.]|uniref:DnaT-like ssDNA-binding domain-containing protein n=1 Tax=Lamprobacter sp. TaxID=3100796 RepID=UPI002B26235B|nr:DnaT-like ssDNA-binding domain-containing protein [Lamprobacter sp.]MEA3642232.1 DnaT-like ssDNA-binding domain-containing protein [Lamprobacter sp.]